MNNQRLRDVFEGFASTRGTTEYMDAATFCRLCSTCKTISESDKLSAEDIENLVRNLMSTRGAGRKLSYTMFVSGLHIISSNLGKSTSNFFDMVASDGEKTIAQWKEAEAKKEEEKRQAEMQGKRIGSRSPDRLSSHSKSPDRTRPGTVLSTTSTMSTMSPPCTPDGGYLAAGPAVGAPKNYIRENRRRLSLQPVPAAKIAADKRRFSLSVPNSTATSAAASRTVSRASSPRGRRRSSVKPVDMAAAAAAAAASIQEAAADQEEEGDESIEATENSETEVGSDDDEVDTLGRSQSPFQRASKWKDVIKTISLVSHLMPSVPARTGPIDRNPTVSRPDTVGRTSPSPAAVIVDGGVGNHTAAAAESRRVSESRRNTLPPLMAKAVKVSDLPEAGDLSDIFLRYSKGSETMDASQWCRFTADSGICDHKFTRNDSDLVFTKVKKRADRKICFQQFLEGMEVIARQKDLPVNLVVTIIVAELHGDEAALKEARKKDRQEKEKRRHSIQGGASSPSLHAVKLDPLAEPRSHSRVSTNKATAARKTPPCLDKMTGKLTLRGVFDNYAHHQRMMDGTQFARLVSDVGIFDKKLTKNDADLIFSQCKFPGERRLHYDEFETAVAALAGKKGVEPHVMSNWIVSQVGTFSNSTINLNLYQKNTLYNLVGDKLYDGEYGQRYHQYPVVPPI